MTDPSTPPPSACDPFEQALVDLKSMRAELDRLRAELGGYRHKSALIDASTKRGITDCSTPLFQRVRNIVEQLEAAEAARATLEAQVRALVSKWTRSVENGRKELEGPCYGLTAVTACARELAALLPPPPQETPR